MQLDKETAGAIMLFIGIISAVVDAIKKARKPPAIPDDPQRIERLKRGDDHAEKINVLIDALNDERRERKAEREKAEADRQADRDKFYQLYNALAGELNKDRNELHQLRADLSTTTQALETERAERRKVEAANSSLMAVVDQQRETIAAKDRQIEKLSSDLAEALDELNRYSESLRDQLRRDTETGGIN